MTDRDNVPALGGPVIVGRASHENLSWQRSGLRTGGRYTGRDYYRQPDEPTFDHLPRTGAAEATGRALKVVGLVVALAGIAGWVWLILAFVRSIGDGTMPDSPFGARLAGIPLGSGGLVAILVGAFLAVAGSWMIRLDRRRVRWEPAEPE